MICQNCNRNIVKPLELYNGDWACPRCKTVISIKSIAVKVNKENDETFKLSELCYLRALKCQNDRKKYDSELGVALEYCRNAARMGNPKALIRMGYYYEYGYITADVAESFRIAYEYYKLVWSTAPEIEDNLPDPDYAESCKKLRSAAARHYLELLKKRPESFRRLGDNYREEKSKIAAKGIFVPDDGEGDASMDESRAMSVLNVLSTCLAQDNSPLFGVMRLEAGDFSKLYSVKDGNAKNAQSKLLKLAKKMLIVLFEADSGAFQTLKTADNCNGIDDDRAHYLYFFNEFGAHGISARKCGKISKALARSNGLGEYTGVKRIVESMARSAVHTDYIFSEDDVLMYKSRLESFAHASDDLVHSITNR